MSSNKKGKGGTALKERKDTRTVGSVQRLGEAVPRKARKANKKLAKSVRKHPTGWGAAAAGIAAGALLGLAARRRNR